MQAFARSGYGWTRHDLRAVVVGGDTVAGSGRRDGYLPSLLPSGSWWPNTLYAGIGVELFAPKRHRVFHRTGYGLRTEVRASSARGVRNALEGSMSVVLGVVGWTARRHHSF